jgi:hypothetical protein
VPLAARVAQRTVIDFLRRPSSLKLVRFVLFSPADLASYASVLAELVPVER